MSKVSIIGAGNVGATAAMKVAEMMNGGEVVLLDIKEGVAEGKAMDISQALAVTGNVTYVTGVTNDYSATENSDIVVITSGVPRKPGMTREELVGVNKGVVESVMDNLLKYQGKNTIYIVVSNPMDTMTMAVLNKLRGVVDNVEKKVIGMGGLLDSNRFKYFIQSAYNKKHIDKLPINHISCYVIGGHGDTTMVPWVPGVAITSVTGEFPSGITEFFTDEEIAAAWEAPAQAICKTIELIFNGTGEEGITCSVYRAFYGLCIGSYVTLDNEGIKNIYNVEGNNADFAASVNAVRNVNAAL